MIQNNMLEIVCVIASIIIGLQGVAIITLVGIAKSNQAIARKSKLKAKRAEGKTKRINSSLQLLGEELSSLQNTVNEYEARCKHYEEQCSKLCNDLVAMQCSYESVLKSNESLQSNMYDLMSQGLILSDITNHSLIQDLEKQGLINTLKIHDMSVGQVENLFGVHTLH